jgi:hypothetical protein
VAVTAVVKVARAEAIAAAAPQQRKPFPAELREERRKVRDDQRSEAGGRGRAEAAALRREGALSGQSAGSVEAGEGCGRDGLAATVGSRGRVSSAGIVDRMTSSVAVNRAMSAANPIRFNSK